jgi:hypothetical protein
VETLTKEEKRPNPKEVTFYIKPRTLEEKVPKIKHCYLIHRSSIVDLRILIFVGLIRLQENKKS